VENIHGRGAERREREAGNLCRAVHGRGEMVRDAVGEMGTEDDTARHAQAQGRKLEIADVARVHVVLLLKVEGRGGF
jgi:hypothetical protein